MKQKSLSPRAKQVLKSLIDLYIHSGEPVGSKALAGLPGMDCSSATIRNIMAELEQAGLIHSPHTSAGRIPTAQGYRLFVDTLLTVRPLNQEIKQHLSQALHSSHNPQLLMKSASDVLSGLTHLAGVVTLPRQNKAILRQVEFLSLSEQRILVILVLNHREIHNRVVMTKKEYSRSELEQAGNFLTQKFAGMTLLNARQALFEAMQADKTEIAHLMDMMMDVAERTFTVEEDKEPYVVAGQGNLLGLVEEGGVDKLQKLFNAFNQKREFLQLFDQCLDAEGMQIFIGEESGLIDSCSLITAPYKFEGERVGVIGVIGPTRMAYDRVIPIVDVTSKLLSMALQQE